MKELDGDTDEHVGMWLVHACAGHHTGLELCNVSAYHCV